MSAVELEKCWCGEPVHHETWCHQHAPRCRSGAHWHGNCQCVGDQELARRAGRVVSKPDRRATEQRLDTRRLRDRTQAAVNQQNDERAMKLILGREPRRATCGACGSDREVTYYMRRDEDSQFRVRPGELTDVFYCGCQSDE